VHRVTDDERQELKDKLLMADLSLKTRQNFWETPRNLALIVAAAAGIAGVLGFKLGQREPLPQQLVFPPGTIITVPNR
jgi:hypothetical protein